MFKNTGKGTFRDVTKASGLGGRQAFSTSALWFDFDRDGLLDLFVCNYVKWSPEHDVFCSPDGKNKSYCTPEAYRGETCWLFHNLGNGKFEDVTPTSGIFDSSSKSLGVAMLDYDQDGWPDLLVANDTQPNKLYRNQRNGTFKDVAVDAGIAFSAEGKARAGMGVDVADFNNSGTLGRGHHQFRQRNDRPLPRVRRWKLRRRRHPERSGASVERQAGIRLRVSRCRSRWLRSTSRWSTDTSTTRCATFAESATPSRPSYFSTTGRENSAMWPAKSAAVSAQPKVGRGLAYGDFDRDGDLDLLITTNNGPAYLYRNDQTAGNKSIRVRLVGTKSNRDAIGARVRIFHGETSQSRLVKGGSSYLSQSELPVTFGLGKRDKIDRLVIDWPSGGTEEYKNLAAGRAYECVESKGIKPLGSY